MNKLDKQYQSILQDILDNGVVKKDRTGTGTISVFGRQIRHRMSEGFPLLTTKKMYAKGIITEIIWFLRGDTNIKYLIDNDCHIWDGDAYQGYLRRINGGLEPASRERFIEMVKNKEESRVDTNDWHVGDLGPIYGKQWRDWTSTTVQEYWDGKEICKSYTEQKIDQISNLINDLRTNPDSRRLLVNAWNVGEIDQMTLPPCHYSFQCWTKELTHEEREKIWVKTQEQYIVDDYENGIGATKELLDMRNIPTRSISLMWNQRSCDFFLGIPFNIASYGLLLEIIANEVNMVPDELIGNLGDSHLYSNHIEQAKEQISRDPYELPTLKIGHFGKIIENIESIDRSDFIIEHYQSHSAIKATLSN